MKNIIKILGIISLMLVIGFSMTSCGEDSDDDDDSGSKFYAESISLTINGNIRIYFYTYSDSTYYDGTLEDIQKEFTVNIDGTKVEIVDFSVYTGVNGGAFYLTPSGIYGSYNNETEEHNVKVTYKASSPNRFYIEYKNKNYFIGNFDLTKKGKFESFS